NERLDQLASRLESTLAAGVAAERFGELPRVLLGGRPNAGKSSLLNRLTGLDRAICSPVPGTTRDCLAPPLRILDGEGLLLELAGLDAPGDELDAAAQAAARRAAETADLVLCVIDASRQASVEVLAEPADLFVLNKIDLIDVEALMEWMHS